MVKTMTSKPDAEASEAETSASERATEAADQTPASPDVEIGGRGGLDPTRYGDWEKNGRCIDF